jgi:hypothetical protein
MLSQYKVGAKLCLKNLKKLFGVNITTKAA